MSGGCLCRVFAAVLLALACASPVDASIDRGAIQGTVTDAQGAVIPGAKVVIKNVDTNVQVSLTTNSAGFYLAPQLVPGRYSVHIAVQGFSPLDITNLTVTAGSTTTADAPLRVGATTQTIEVKAAALLVESNPSNFATGLQSVYIAEMPLEGRDIQALVQMVPGVTQSSGPSGVLFGFNSQFGGFPDPLHFAGSNLSVNGGLGMSSNWYLDGSLNTSPGVNSVVVNPSPDAVAELNVVNNGLAAEWGRTGGAIFNVVLKSGSNSFHGNLYGFNRNSFFSASNPFSRRDERGRPFLEPRVNWNDFGGTLGGPLRKNRTFFFASYDVSFLHEKKPTILTVPLPQERLGDFRGNPFFDDVCDPTSRPDRCLYDSYTTQGPNPDTGQFSRTPFQTPVIPSDRIDPLAAFYLSTYPNPNFVDPLSSCPFPQNSPYAVCDNFLGPVGSSMTVHNFSMKIDHAIHEKHKLFGEWLFNPSYYTNFRYPWNGPTAATQTGIEGAQPYRTIPQIFAVGFTSSFTPTVVNEARVTFNRWAQIAIPNSDSVTGNSSVKENVKGLNFWLFEPFQPVPTVSVGGLPGFGPQQWQNALQGNQTITVLDNLTKVISKHTLKTGFMFRQSALWYNGAWGFNLSFGGGLTADPVTGQGGSGLAQFLLGATDQFGTYSGVWIQPRLIWDYWAFDGQDEWRVTPNFSLNFGLRYDIFGWFHERHNFANFFDPSLRNPKVPFQGKLVYAGTPSHPAGNVFPAHKDSLGPRISFAWSPGGSRKTVIRGGFGVVYANGAFEPNGGTGGDPIQSAYIGFYGDYTGQSPAFRLSGGAPSLPLSSFDPAGVRKRQDQFLGSTQLFYEPGSKDSYAEQWSFYVQRELPGNMALSVGYVGAHGLHLPGDAFRNINYVSTANREKLRNNIYNPVPVDASLASIWGCGIDAATSKALCPAYLVLTPYPQYYPYITVNYARDGFNRYHSFQLKYEKRASHGVSVFAAYTIQKNIQSVNFGSLAMNYSTPTTWSQGMGRTAFVPGAASGGLAEFRSGGSARPEDPDNRRRYVALAPDDIPQILNLGVTYELPLGQGKAFLNRPGFADKLFGGWKLTQNWNLQSGIALLFTSPCNGISCRPNLIGDPSRGRGSKSRQQLETQWYDPSAFEAPFGSDPTVIQEVTTGLTPGGQALDFNTLDEYWRLGNIGTRPPTGRMPGYWNANMTLAKEFHLTESKYLQFRWEVFNAFNHQSLGVPNTGWCLPPIQNTDGTTTTDAIHIPGCSFGKITSIQTDPRAMQFAVKFFW